MFLTWLFLLPRMQAFERRLIEIRAVTRFCQSPIFYSLFIIIRSSDCPH